MGIDIRDGAQLECINCGLCIDACNEVMEKVGRPRGLIAYDTDAAVAARKLRSEAATPSDPPRTLYYTRRPAHRQRLMIWGFSTARPGRARAARPESGIRAAA
jgi:polyferredoxin